MITFVLFHIHNLIIISQLYVQKKQVLCVPHFKEQLINTEKLISLLSITLTFLPLGFPVHGFPLYWTIFPSV